MSNEDPPMEDPNMDPAQVVYTLETNVKFLREENIRLQEELAQLHYERNADVYYQENDRLRAALETITGLGVHYQPNVFALAPTAAREALQETNQLAAPQGAQADGHGAVAVPNDFTIPSGQSVQEHRGKRPYCIVCCWHHDTVAECDQHEKESVQETKEKP